MAPSRLRSRDSTLPRACASPWSVAARCCHVASLPSTRTSLWAAPRSLAAPATPPGAWPAARRSTPQHSRQRSRREQLPTEPTRRCSTSRFTTSIPRMSSRPRSASDVAPTRQMRMESSRGISSARRSTSLARPRPAASSPPCPSAACSLAARSSLRASAAASRSARSAHPALGASGMGSRRVCPKRVSENELPSSTLLTFSPYRTTSSRNASNSHSRSSRSLSQSVAPFWAPSPPSALSALVLRRLSKKDLKSDSWPVLSRAQSSGVALFALASSAASASAARFSAPCCAARAATSSADCAWLAARSSERWRRVSSSSSSSLAICVKAASSARTLSPRRARPSPLLWELAWAELDEEEEESPGHVHEHVDSAGSTLHSASHVLALRVRASFSADRRTTLDFSSLTCFWSPASAPLNLASMDSVLVSSLSFCADSLTSQSCSSVSTDIFAASASCRSLAYLPLAPPCPSVRSWRNWPTLL
mmetsp:Transcript_48659/g.118532  ORF Transcript_48659/g.118532 Transcript_48659/m.118532 type:complete len:480 (-) Transcript_48659:186-1625(-)